MEKMIVKEAYSRQQKEIIEKLSNIIDQGIKQCRNSEAFKEYLKMQSKMPNYSVNNTLLILSQTKGQATNCASYTVWRSLGRQVNKGEKGIQVICPSPYKKEIQVERKDSQGQTVYGKDGKPIMETAEVKRMAFKPGYVFDISQTTGAELPSPVKLLSGEVQGYEDVLAAIRMSSPVPIVFESLHGTANGYYSSTDERIVISDNLEPLHAIKTCLHELAHAYLDTIGQDKERSREERETEAEAIAFILTNRLLGDQVTPEEIGQYSFGYLASWGDENLSEFKECLSTIQQSSSFLIYKIEASLNRILSDKETVSEPQHIQTSAQVNEVLNSQHLHL